MRVRLASFGIPKDPKSRIAETVRYLVLLVVIAVISVAAALIYQHFHRESQAKKAAASAGFSSATIQKAESISSAPLQQDLKSRNLQAYQDSQLIYAGSYISAGDYKNADRVLKDIQKYVPSNQWEVTTYQYLAQVAKHNGDTANYKKYTLTLIDQLNKTGDTKEADYYSQQLQGGH